MEGFQGFFTGYSGGRTSSGHVDEEEECTKISVDGVVSFNGGRGRGKKWEWIWAGCGS
jgi:hypothetical protein